MQNEPGYRPMDAVVFIGAMAIFLFTSVQTDWGKEILRQLGIDVSW